MRKIVVSIQNGLLAESLTEMLRYSGEFDPYRVAVDRKKRAVPACMACDAEIVLMEVSQAAGASVAERLSEVHQIRLMVPNCKIVFLCDENSTPEITREVTQAKRDGVIDNFFYSSVTTRYLLAALTAV